MPVAWFVTFGIIVAMLCFRLSAWFDCEAEYWRGVSLEITLNPDSGPKHLDDLEWAQTHRPSLLRKLLGWTSPPDRRRG